MRWWMLVAGLGLAGCAPTVAENVATCQTYGFTPGTVELATCAQTLDAEWQARMQEALVNANTAYQSGQRTEALQQSVNQQQPQWIAPPISAYRW